MDFVEAGKGDKGRGEEGGVKGEGRRGGGRGKGEGRRGVVDSLSYLRVKLYCSSWLKSEVFPVEIRLPVVNCVCILYPFTCVFSCHSTTLVS